MIGITEAKLYRDSTSLGNYLIDCVEAIREVATLDAINNIVCSAEEAVRSFQKKWEGNAPSAWVKSEVSMHNNEMYRLTKVLSDALGRRAA